MTAPRVANLVRDALRRDGAYDFGLGVVLRAPTVPRGSGASASYRIEHRLAPLLPGKPAATRRQSYARDLNVAYARARAVFEEMQQRAAGTFAEYHTDVPFGEVVERWHAPPALGRPLPREGRQPAALLGHRRRHRRAVARLGTTDADRVHPDRRAYG
ncbi:MAG: hypothetical protein KY462_12780 [Actinobacteria bacterium]|nr:hypothetical protein [Actinomycetota bacterium]